ncbi:MAG: short-chain dehydrogenase [Chitinophagaceae bacterium]|nr:short-chain dehydrogenase [Chitinophagaceae bacterium]
MTSVEIEKFMSQKNKQARAVQISFKTRASMKGLFIELADYQDLKRKNLWRIVSESNLGAYQQTNDNNLARIFNGIEITRLEVV